MKKTVIHCDICGTPGGYEYTFAVGREMDAAGDTDYVYEGFDLCSGCSYLQLESLISTLPLSSREALISGIVKRKKFYPT